MKLSAFALLSFFGVALMISSSAARALPAADALAQGLAAHKAVYDINLVATHSGSQIINIGGKMTYEWKKTCGAWVTDHHFKLNYDYAESPGMRIESDFSTYEDMNGRNFNFTSRRHRDRELYQELRGHAAVDAKGGQAIFTAPSGLKFDLSPGTLFPVGHTLELIRHAKAGDKFYSAAVFDGSDEEGPIEINSFIGKAVQPSEVVKGDKIESSLLSGKAWKVRMAVFPQNDQEERADYEMSLVFHDNGIISDMLIDYDDFSVTQRLVSLEKIQGDSCATGENASVRP